MIDEYKCKECSLGWWPNKNLTGNVFFFTALCMLLLDLCLHECHYIKYTDLQINMEYW